MTVDEVGRNEVVEATGQLVVPQTKINGNWVIGFDPEQILQYAGK